MPISARLVIGIISFCAAMSGVVLGNMFMLMMIGQINRKRQTEDLVSYFGYWLPKTVQLFSEYRKSYPNGRLHICVGAALSLQIAGAVGFGLCLLTIR